MNVCWESFLHKISHNQYTLAENFVTFISQAVTISINITVSKLNEPRIIFVSEI